VSIAFVQQITGGTVGGSSMSVALTPSAGSLLVATVGDFNIGILPGVVSDDKGNTWRNFGWGFNGANDGCSMWYATNVAAGLTNVSYTGNWNRNFINVQEYTGTSLGSVSFCRNFNLSSSTTPRTGSIQTVPTNRLLVACFLNSIANPATVVPASGFTELTTVTNALTFFSAYKIVASAAISTDECSWTSTIPDCFALMGQFAESPRFIAQRPVGGRGASW
jgi:hypothetical protein